MRFAVHFGNTGVRPQGNVGHFLDLVDQILGHGARQRASAHQNHHAVGVFREIHGRLSRRIRAADDVDRFALAGNRFRRSAAVINARALQAIDSRGFQAPPLHSGGDHQGVAGNLVAVRHLDDAVGTLGANSHSFLRRQNFHAEALRLHHRSPRQIAAAEPGREIQDNSRCENSSPPVRRALRARSSRYADPPKRRTRRQPGPQARRPRSPGRKNWFARRSGVPLFARLPPARSPAASLHPETARREAWTPPAQALRAAAWFPDRWPKARHQSIGKARGCAPENRAIRTSAATIACPARECPGMRDGRKPASRPANRRAGDKDGRQGDPTAS